MKWHGSLRSRLAVVHGSQVELFLKEKNSHIEKHRLFFQTMREHLFQTKPAICCKAFFYNPPSEAMQPPQ